MNKDGLTFFRCTLCHCVVSKWDVDAGGCPKCKGVRIMPSDLSWWEKLVQLVKHPKVWEWPADDLHTHD